MQYLALASDYDGTLARDGVVHPETIDAMERLVHSGRKIILVTGRRLADVFSVFSRLDLFERIVVENGAVLYNPATKRKQILAAPPPDEFAERLRGKGFTIALGDVVVDAWRIHAPQIEEIIDELGLDLHLIFNFEGVMILPCGVDKMTGLEAALAELGISSQEVVAVGDGENDIELLNGCGFAVAVANAIPQLKARANLITEAQDGEGVAELIETIMRDELPLLRRSGD